MLLDYATTLKEPEDLSINPMGKVPAICHGDIVVTETAAICAYLADIFTNAGLAPAPGSPLRGPYYRWLFFTAGPVEAAVSNQALGFVVPEGCERMIGYGTYEQTLDVLEDAVSQGEYLWGDMFSAADIYTGSYLGFAMQTGGIEKRSAFGAY